MKPGKQHQAKLRTHILKPQWAQVTVDSISKTTALNKPAAIKGSAAGATVLFMNLIGHTKARQLGVEMVERAEWSGVEWR